MANDRLTDKIYGCLTAGLIGDAMGAPTEGMHYKKIIEEFGPNGVTDFEGVGTDDTAIREQLIDAIFKSDGRPTVDHFGQSFLDFKERNRHLWFVPVRNAFYKLEQGLELPAYAGIGNMQSSSTAMAISPMGIINACNPRQAVLETMDVASFIHNGPSSGYCRDAACAMAASRPASRPMRPSKQRGTSCPCEIKTIWSWPQRRDRERFREGPSLTADSMETIPGLTDPRPGRSRAFLWGANFGRDADTITTMIGGCRGRDARRLRPSVVWVAKVEANPNVTYRETQIGWR